jgi:hypothetical protein
MADQATEFANARVTISGWVTEEQGIGPGGDDVSGHRFTALLTELFKAKFSVYTVRVRAEYRKWLDIQRNDGWPTSF